MDWDEQRQQMVQTQLEKRGIRNPRVLEVMRSVPRHLFVPESLRAQAYDDRALGIGHEQTISQPYMVALMLEALDLKGLEKVLEIGTGGGYQAALLGRLAAEVHTLEIVPELALRARQQLSELGMSNVSVYCRDGSGGFSSAAPFDGIIVAAAAPKLPPLLPHQLAPGGRLVIPIGEIKHAVLTVVQRNGNEYERRELGACVFVPLTGAFGVVD